MDFLKSLLNIYGRYVSLLLMTIVSVGGQTTLYKFDEPIVQLTSHNFSQIDATDNAWLVEFYATWCGHCRRFAPTFSQLAKDMQSWHKVIKVAAIACSDPSNTHLCEYYHIWGYPTVKFFPPHAKFHTGFHYHGDKTVDSLRTSAIHFLHRTLENQPRSWPLLDPLRNVNETWTLATEETKLAFVVYEDANGTDDIKYIGREIILDFSSHPEVIVTRVVDPEAVDSSGVVTPALCQVRPDGSPAHCVSTAHSPNSSRENFGNIINSVLMAFKSQTTPTTTEMPETTTLKKVISDPDGTHMQDLESALYYSLWVEVATHPNITGDTLRALKSYIYVLRKYFPGETYHTKFLNRVYAWLRLTSTLTGARWQHRISSFRDCGAHCDDTYKLRWVGCRGSQPGFRGYPCGLWTLFHTLTVQAYNLEHQSDSYQPREVLTAVRDYVMHFLGCRECAGHFLQMAAQVTQEVVTPEDGVLWLWGAHNKANRRLAGDPTEDPNHPKVQFPSSRTCPQCRLSQSGSGKNISIEWNTPQVLAYLRQFYGSSHIIQDTQPNGFFSYDKSPANLTTTEIPPATSPACIKQSSVWGDCSKSCGTGISVRMSNDNTRCRMEMETRLCMLKKCQSRKSKLLRKRGRCNTSPMSSRSQVLRLGKCRTLQRAPQCSSCPEKCCYPTKHHTVWLRTVCQAKKHKKSQRYRGFSQVMWIDECTCKEECPGHR